MEIFCFMILKRSGKKNEFMMNLNDGKQSEYVVYNERYALLLFFFISSSSSTVLHFFFFHQFLHGFLDDDDDE